MTLEEQKAAKERFEAQGMGVEFQSVHGIGIVSARGVTPEEMERGRQEFSKQFYPDFRPRWMPPLPGQTK